MVIIKYIITRYSPRNSWLLNAQKNAIANRLQQVNCFCGIPSQIVSKFSLKHTCYWNNGHLFTQPHNRYCKGLLDDDVNTEKELKKISELFPQPRVTLNELQSKTPNKIFDIHYKQNVVAPKAARKKTQNKDWTCTYTFVWPDTMKFESVAISKRHAAEKAATQALNWMFKMKRINSKGYPIYDKNVLADIHSKLNDPICATISEHSVQRIGRIWNDYESEIKDIYEATFQAAAMRMVPTPAVLTKDSTIDDEDGYTEESPDFGDDVTDISELKVPLHPVFGRIIKPPTQATLDRRDRALTQRFQLYDEEITPLPIDQYTKQITSTVQNSRVTVIVGAAGCGKSTRAPAAILRNFGAKTTMIVSEPRRVAAIGLAQRVASELGEEVGDSVGYQVRLHAKPPRPPSGSILYCTSGILLKRLQLNPGLEGCTHVIIDEAHERDVNTDVTLLLLKRALDINPELKIIVMSATLDIGVFTNYFDSCPVIEVPGRTFPVHVSYLDDIQKKFRINLPNTMKNCTKEDGKPYVDCQEIVEVIKSVDKYDTEGAILVFLPGWAEIKQTKQLLDAHFGSTNTHLILPVHSRLSTTDQTKMFSKPQLGVRKIVLATNIAETSITIPDVVYVVDVGAHKENRIKDGTGTASLETVWVSQAGAKQRTGRAGRVQPGHCYRLYTKEREANFAPHTTPEILRIPLEQTVLDCKTYAPDDKVENFLSELPEPPTKKAIKFAVDDLVDLGALTPTEQLTRLGHLLSAMSLHPRLGRGLLHSAVVCSVIAAANVATHCSDNVEVFTQAADRREEIRDIKRQFSDTSDHAALHWLQQEFEQSLSDKGWRGVDDWCDKYGLRKDRLSHVKSLSNLHLEQLLKSGIIEPTAEPHELNRFSDIDELTSSVLLSGCNCLLKTRRHVSTKRKLMTVIDLITSTGDRAHIGTESVNYGITKRSPKTSLLAYFGGFHSTERRALVVYKTSLVTPQAVLLFSKGDISKREIVDDNGNPTTILTLPRHRLTVNVPSSQADLIVKAREMLWNTFQYYIERDVKHLDYEENTTVSRFKARLVKAVGRVLVEAHKEYIQGEIVTSDDQ